MQALRPCASTRSLPLPEYIASGDQHLMPGGYAGEVLPDDVSGPANYDVGMFATVCGQAGPWNNLAGRTLVSWLQQSHPDFRPKRILDLGCGLGHNTLPVREAFPDAEIVAIDVAAPMLRYGHARARSLGVTDVQFIQADATATGLEAGSFDLVFTTMVLHETSAEALAGIFRECRRLVREGGIVAHLEQPPYRRFGPFEQFMRDWDGAITTSRSGRPCMNSRCPMKWSTRASTGIRCSKRTPLQRAGTRAAQPRILAAHPSGMSSAHTMAGRPMASSCGSPAKPNSRSMSLCKNPPN